jgi:hypothetical protein
LGLSFVWSTWILVGVALAALAGLWLNFLLVPGSRSEEFAAELVLAVAILVTLTNTASLFQYAAIAIGMPFADSWLAAADAAIGVNVAALAHWTWQHPMLRAIFLVGYGSFMPQQFAAIGVLAWTRDRTRLWEYAFEFHVCLIISVLALVAWPAVCPPAWYGFAPAIDMTHLIGQIKALHVGALKEIRVGELEGLVSFPSFHVGGALVATWAVRRHRKVFLGFALLNAVLFLSTFVTGVHYAIDVLASFPLFAFSVWLYRRSAAFDSRNANAASEAAG